MPVDKEKLEQKGYLLIWNLWKTGIDSINGMRVVNTYALYHWNKFLENFLHTEENENNNTYLESCFRQRHHLYPFIVLVDGLLGVEADDTLKHISIRLTKKYK